MYALASLSVIRSPMSSEMAAERTVRSRGMRGCMFCCGERERRWTRIYGWTQRGDLRVNECHLAPPHRPHRLPQSPLWSDHRYHSPALYFLQTSFPVVAAEVRQRERKGRSASSEVTRWLATLFSSPPFSEPHHLNPKNPVPKSQLSLSSTIAQSSSRPARLEIKLARPRIMYRFSVRLTNFIFLCPTARTCEARHPLVRVAPCSMAYLVKRRSSSNAASTTIPTTPSLCQSACGGGFSRSGTSRMR